VIRVEMELRRLYGAYWVPDEMFGDAVAELMASCQQKLLGQVTSEFRLPDDLPPADLSADEPLVVEARP
jgi:hypothetical protein